MEISKEFLEKRFKYFEDNMERWVNEFKKESEKAKKYQDKGYLITCRELLREAMGARNFINELLMDNNK